MCNNKYKVLIYCWIGNLISKKPLPHFKEKVEICYSSSEINNLLAELEFSVGYTKAPISFALLTQFKHEIIRTEQRFSLPAHFCHKSG